MMIYIQKFISDKQFLIILFILIFGLLYKIFLTWDGNFIFNMDNGRDMVDVREIVELGKFRMIGHTTGIEGLYNGPFWYYFLSVGYILSGGNPYSGILMMIFSWFVGGLFLYFLTKKYGFLISITIQLIWLSSNYIMLSTVYTFNPNPILLLMPVFIYFLERFIVTNKLKFSLIFWGLAGLFINFELAYGIFIPVIIFLVLLYSNHIKLLVAKNFLIGLILFLLFCLPQVIFELRHNFFMTNAVIAYINSDKSSQSISLINRFQIDFKVFYQTLIPTFMNNQTITKIFFVGLIVIFISFITSFRKNIDLTSLIAILFLLVPYIGFSLAPMTLYTWHITGSLAAAVILFSSEIFIITKFNKITKFLIYGFCFYIIIFSIYNLEIPKNIFSQKQSNDPSNYRNQLNAVDYIFNSAQGKDFKVYIYLPSVIDYSYQYIIWWRGKNYYGYTPQDYAYLPGKPEYINEKNRFIIKNDNSQSSVIYLIKEPDRIGQRDLWENSFKDLKLIKSEKIGPLIVETRKADSS